MGEEEGGDGVDSDGDGNGDGGREEGGSEKVSRVPRPVAGRPSVLLGGEGLLLDSRAPSEISIGGRRRLREIPLRSAIETREG